MTSEGTHKQNESLQRSISVSVCPSVCLSIRQKLLSITWGRRAVGSRVISAGFREISIGRAGARVEILIRKYNARRTGRVGRRAKHAGVMKTGFDSGLDGRTRTCLSGVKRKMPDTPLLFPPSAVMNSAEKPLHPAVGPVAVRSKLNLAD